MFNPKFPSKDADSVEGKKKESPLAGKLDGVLPPSGGRSRMKGGFHTQLRFAKIMALEPVPAFQNDWRGAFHFSYPFDIR
ncbi:MAG: hypothetical protein WC003_11440 [Terrimicrobiaceae bacterium]